MSISSEIVVDVDSQDSMSAAESLALELRTQTADAYTCYRTARQIDDLDAAHVAWVRYGLLEDAAIRLEYALETAKVLLASEV
jgi:hypothetical protein